MGWAESCETCQINHWVAAAVHDQVVSMEADQIDDANVYVLNIKRKQ